MCGDVGDGRCVSYAIMMRLRLWGILCWSVHEEFTCRRRQLIRKIGRMEGAERWVEEYERGDKEVKVALHAVGEEVGRHR